jgi:hypothetical protein
MAASHTDAGYDGAAVGTATVADSVSLDGVTEAFDQYA